MEKEQEGLTICEMFKYIWIKKIPSLIIFLITVIICLGGMVVFNSKKVSYTTKFNLNWTNINNNQYPDGSLFNYKDIISFDELNGIKESDEQYANLDIKKIVDSGSISIEQSVDENNTQEKQKYYYTITIIGDEFKDELQVKNFIIDLLNVQIKKARILVGDFKIYRPLNNINEQTDYEDIFPLINNQINVLEENIKELINQLNENFLFDNLITKAPQSLANLKEELESLKSEYFNLNLNAIYLEKYYVRDLDLAAIKIDNKISKINLELKKATMEKNSLVEEREKFIKEHGSTSTIIESVASFNSRIAELTSKIALLEYELEISQNFKNNKNFNEEYDNLVNTYIEKFNTLADKVDKAKIDTVANTISLFYYDASIVVTDQPFNLILIILVPIFVGLLLTFIIMIIKLSTLDYQTRKLVFENAKHPQKAKQEEKEKVLENKDSKEE